VEKLLQLCDASANTCDCDEEEEKHNGSALPLSADRKSLCGKSPENGNISDIGGRLSADSPVNCSFSESGEHLTVVKKARILGAFRYGGANYANLQTKASGLDECPHRDAQLRRQSAPINMGAAIETTERRGDFCRKETCRRCTATRAQATYRPSKE
jgi:hypothetical protein